MACFIHCLCFLQCVIINNANIEGKLSEKSVDNQFSTNINNHAYWPILAVLYIRICPSIAYTWKNFLVSHIQHIHSTLHKLTNALKVFCPIKTAINDKLCYSWYIMATWSKRIR